MTWEDIWKRLWLVLRSRLSRHRVCPECGWLLVQVFTGNFGGVDHYEWACEDCAELKWLEKRKLEEERQKVEKERSEAAARLREALYAPALAGYGPPVTHLNKHYC